MNLSEALCPSCRERGRIEVIPYGGKLKALCVCGLEGHPRVDVDEAFESLCNQKTAHDIADIARRCEQLQVVLRRQFSNWI